MKTTEITPLILTYNEEANLGRSLSRLDWAERIVVVDSFSTDGTPEIAAADPRVRLVRREFDSFARQCNFGLEGVETEWVLSLDADYLVTDELVREIEALPVDPEEAGFEVGFEYVVLEKVLRGSLYPPRVVLYRRPGATYEQDGHSHRVRVPGPVGRLSATILHDDRKPLSVWLEAQDRYTREEARKLRRTPSEDLSRNDRLRVWLLGPLLVPPYCLVVKRVILDGRAGWYYTLQRTYAEVLLALRLVESA